MSHNVFELEKGANFHEVVKTSNLPVIVVFLGGAGGPEKKVYSLYEEKAKSTQKFNLLKIYLDDHQEIADELDVKYFPSVYLFKDGVKVQEAQGKEEATTVLDTLVESL